MSKVIITVGIPASGKTYWANEYVKTHPNTVISCRDDIRAIGHLPFGDPEVEKRITDIQRNDIRLAVDADLNVIVADTNINDRFRNDLIEFLLDLGAAVQIIPFPVSLETALERDANRERTVGYDVIKRFHDAYQAMDYIGNEVRVRVDSTLE